MTEVRRMRPDDVALVIGARELFDRPPAPDWDVGSPTTTSRQRCVPYEAAGGRQQPLTRLIAWELPAH